MPLFVHRRIIGADQQLAILQLHRHLLVTSQQLERVTDPRRADTKSSLADRTARPGRQHDVMFRVRHRLDIFPVQVDVFRRTRDAARRR